MLACVSQTNKKVLNNEPVKGCSGKIINATTSGNVTVKTDDGVMCELNNIRIVPGLVKNIISINQVRDERLKKATKEDLI